MKGQKYLYLGLTMLFLLVMTTVSAQETLTETYSTGEIMFRYPADSTVEISENGIVYVDTDDYFVSILSPDILAVLDLGDIRKIQRLLSEFLEIIEAEAGKSSTIDLDGREIVRQDYTDEEFTGFVLAFALEDGSLVMMDAFSDVLSTDDYADTVLDIAATIAYDDGSIVPQDQAAGKLPATLEDYAAEWPDAVKELETLGVIPSGGSLVFLENRAFFSGRGEWFTGLARRASNTDIVMAGELTFNVGDPDELETCSLLSRIVTDNEGQAIRFLDIGILNDGAIYYLDRFGAGEDDFFSDEFAIDDFDFASPHHFMIIALDDTLTVYLDGERIINQAEINERAGSYGVALRGRGANSLCEGRNIWVYEAPSVEVGVCEATANSTVNKRSGPGTSYAVAGSLEGATTSLVIGQSTDNSGFVWWQLEDESWVRDDVVNARGDCQSVPVVTP